MEKLPRWLGLVLMVLQVFFPRSCGACSTVALLFFHPGSNTRVLPSTDRDDLDLLVSNNPYLSLARLWGGPILEGVIPFQARAHLPWQDSSVCNWSDSLHTGAVPKTAHNKLLTQNNRTGNQLSTALVLLCRFCSPFLPAVLLAGVVFGACALLCSVSGLWFFSSSLPPLCRCALLCCLRPLVVLARLVLLRWGCFFFSSGRATTPEPIAFCRYSVTLASRKLSLNCLFAGRNIN